MTRFTWGLLAAPLLAFVGTSLALENSRSLAGIKCFLMPQKDIQEEKSIDFKEGKLYFCCPDCIETFTEEKEKYLAKANHQLVRTHQYRQHVCPFSGGPLNRETTLEIGGAKISFCCMNCKEKASKVDGDEQIELVFGKAPFEKGKFSKVKETPNP